MNIRELAWEKGREEDLDKYIGKANNMPEVIIRDIIESLGYYYVVWFIYA